MLKTDEQSSEVFVMTAQFRNLVFLFFACALLSSCLQDREKTSIVTASASWFDGVATAQNLGGYPSSIKVSWSAAAMPVSSYRVYSLQYDDTTKNNTWALIEEVSSSATSYTHSDLTAGKIYSYMVHAVDTNKIEDTNTKQVSTVAFDGISSVKITGTTTATVTLNTNTGAFNQVRVYAQPTRSGGAKTLVATANGNVSTINVTGLKSGVKYKFYVSAFMNYLNAEDGNESYIEAQTSSDSFGTGATNDTNYSYRGVMSVMAYGDSPHAPANPQKRTITLTWPAFNGAVSTTKYQVTRTTTSYTPDPTTTTVCTSAILTSCIVSCANSGAGTQTCSDIALAAAPVNYYYVISLIKTDPGTNEQWVEELPTANANDFYIKASVPPDNMVLVQRDAANYEMCLNMGKASDPRKHQRCVYNGIAATPYNSGPGKPALTFDSGYYDFGYNLFVDRYRLACNWTRSTVSTACGANGCIDVTATSPPNSALGNVGDTFFAIASYWGRNCYYKTSSGWTSINNLTDPAQIRSATTIDPGIDGDKHNPQINGMSQAQAYNLCHAQTSSYGNKRLLRRREYVHAAAFPTIPGEPNAISDRTLESNIRNGDYNSSNAFGGQLPGYYRCASGNENYRLTVPANLTQLLASTNTRSQIYDSTIWWANLNYMSYPYFIGTVSTSKCISRWGVQDPISFASYDGSNIIYSDSFVRSNSTTVFPATFSPTVSSYDSGVYYDWINYALDGVTGPALGTSTGGTFDQWLNMSIVPSITRFVLPLGMPMVANNSNYTPITDVIYNGALGSNAFNSQSNSQNTHAYDISSVRYVLMEGGSSQRFSYTIHPDGDQIRFRATCAVEAE